MSAKLRTFGLTPERDGSNGIPRRAIEPVDGKPLIVWTSEAAAQARMLDAVVVSSDDEIAAVSRGDGAIVPYRGLDGLSQGNPSGLDPMPHTINQRPQLNAVQRQQPTSPLRTTEHVGRRIPANVSGAPKPSNVRREPIADLL